MVGEYRLAGMRGGIGAAILRVVPMRCLIVDDNAHFLATLRTILSGGELDVVGEATSMKEAIARATELGPDVVLLDIDLGEESGFVVARELVESTGELAPSIVFISAHPESDFADLIADSPALGFVAKSEISTAAIIEVLGAGGDGVAARPEPSS